MPISKETAALWDRANRRNAARIGLGDRADALHQIPTIKALIASIGTNPAALELLAARSHELTDAQRTAALKAACPAPKAHKPKAAPKVSPPTLRGMSGISLWGKHGAPRP